MEMNLNSIDFRTMLLISLLISSEIRQGCFICSSQYFRDYTFFPQSFMTPYAAGEPHTSFYEQVVFHKFVCL